MRAPRPAGTGAPAAAAPVPTKSPEQAKTLSILYWQAPTILNSHQATGTKDFDAAAVILEPLARYNEKDELVPYLAAETPDRRERRGGRGRHERHLEAEAGRQVVRR